MVDRQGKTARMVPFPMDDVARNERGVLGYTSLPRSLVAMLETTVANDPTAEALVELDGERVTYQEYWDRSARVAGGLREAGVRKGDRVAILLPNGNDWAYAFFGILMTGAVVVPVNTRFAPPEIEYVLTDSGSTVAIGPDEPLPDGEPYVADLDPTDLAGIFYTSGTTGFPKGAMTTQENFLSNCETCRRVVGFTDVDGSGLRNLISVPMFHVTGCNSQLLLTAYMGGTTVIMPAFEPQRFLRALIEERINVVTSAPAILWLGMNQENFSDFDMSGVGWVTYGGAPTAPDVIARIRSSFPNALLGNGFGLTETSSVSTYLPDEWCEKRPETVGFAAPVVELDLADEDPATGVGELLIRGQNVVSGYWQKPEQTADTFIDEWLHTGDLARIDDDGFVQIVDRMKDMVNRGGENVYCVEVENALVQHPDIFEVAVLGVPDAMMGEKVGAVVVPRPGRQIDGAELRSFVSDLLADFKVPQFVAVREEPLPRNPGGKVLKPDLRKTTEWGSELR
jgi:acyl-CoA synthetase (AMP-forming)/AMP-acid ligase II